MKGKMITSVRSITISSYIAMLFLGVGCTIIGAVARNIGLTPYQIGLLIAIQQLGFILSLLVTGSLADRLPKPRLLFVGSMILGFSFMAFYQVEFFWMNMAIMFVTGIGMGVFEGTTDALLIDCHSDNSSRYITINHLYITIGSTLITLLFVFLQSKWRLGLVPAGVMVLALSLFFCSAKAPAARNANSLSFWGNLKQIRNKSLVAVLFLATLLAVGLEVGTIGYLTTYLMELRNFTQITSKISLVLFLCGIASGRLLIGLIIRDEWVLNFILGLFGVSIFCFTGLYLFDTNGFLFSFIFIAGITVSALCPLLISLAGVMFRQQAGAVIGLIKVAIPGGGILLPLLVSLAAKQFSLATAVVLFPSTALLGFMLMWATRHYIARSIAIEATSLPQGSESPV